MMTFTGGLPETECGRGSTLQVTENLRKELPGLLSELAIGSLLDAPCGDFNWMRRVDLAGVDYLGVDVQHLELAEQRRTESNANSVTFMAGDIIDGELPRADAILCRDFLQHLPHVAAWFTLRNFVRTGARWLLLTSFDNEVNEDIATEGDFRQLNLEAEPFNLPAPFSRIEDPPGSGRILGVWSNVVGAS